jgi:hypothetical protein
MKAILVGLLGKIPIPSPAMVVALLALFIAASGTAVAAISFTDADGNITACADRKNGALRVLQSGQTSCTSKETQLAWKDGSTLLGKNGKAADSNKLDSKDATDFLGRNAQATDSAKLDGAVPDAYGGVMTGRINGINGAPGGKFEYGAATGISGANGYQSSVNKTLSPAQPVVLRDFAAQLMGERNDDDGVVMFYIIVGGDNNGGGPVLYHLCDIVVVHGESSCTAPAGITIPAGTPIELAVDSSDDMASVDALFGYRLTTT